MKKKFIIILVLISVLCIAGGIVVVVFSNREDNDTAPVLQQENTHGSLSLVCLDPDSIPDYNGEDYIILNDGIPCFNEWDIENITGEHYSELDNLGRCGVAYAMLDRTMIPTGEREDIGHIHLRLHQVDPQERRGGLRLSHRPCQGPDPVQLL